MRLDRAEQAGFGIALGAHVLLVAILSMGFLAIRTPPVIKRQAIEVQLVDEVGLESAAPQISETPPAPKLAEVEGPVEPDVVPPEAAPVPEPAPVQKATPRPAQVPKPVPALKQAVAKPAPPVPAKTADTKPKPPVRTAGRLKGMLSGLSERESDSRSETPPASVASPAVQSSLAAAVRRQLKPHWKAPTGADAEQLRTELTITLARDGSVTNIQVLRQTGITPSNRAQAGLHKERAIAAVRLASPFQLPAQFYDTWKVLSPIGFDKRLSQ